MPRPPAASGGDRPSRRAALLAAVVALLAVGSVAAPALASPQPDVACDVCGVKYEHGAKEVGVNVTVTHSTAEVRVFENGTAAWVVHNRLTLSSADRLRSSSASLDSVTAASFAAYPEGPVENPSRVETSLSDRTVTVRYRDAAPVSRSFGVTLVEYFDTNGYDYWYVVNADRLRVVGPEGTHVTNQPALATVDGRTVTWRGDSSEVWGGTDLSDGARIVYADAGTGATGLRTTAALWGDTLPIYLDNLRSFLLPTVLVAGVLTLAGLGLARRFGSRVRSQQVGRALWALGTVAVVAAVSAGVAMDALENASWWVGVAALLATVGWLAAERPERFATPRRAAVTGLVGAVVGVAVATPLFVLAGSPAGDSPLPALVRLLLLLVPLALAPAAGLLAGRTDPRWVLAGWATLVAGFALATASIVPVADRPFGLIIFVLLIGAVVGSVVATPLATLGAGFADRRPG